MQTVIWNTLTSAQQQQLLSRPAINAAAGIEASVRDIIAAIRERGDHALMEFSRRFDRFDGEQLRVEQAQIDAASARLDDDIKQAIATAAANIGRFHQAQHSDPIRVETQAGVTCELHTRPISAVGLYVPGGTAPLPSTVMMLAIPARIAGCTRKVLCSPPPIADEILYAASVCGVDEIYQVGGAQAVAALAYGTQSINKVDKIFGPGNAYVTEAKRQVSGDHQGAAIDMPAGPSEVLVIADGKANAAFVAADFLSQAEHGVDSQSILVTDCAEFADAVADEIEQQLVQLSRQEIARQALAHSQLIICDDLTQCVAVSNQYAPEHLIIQTENAHALVDAIEHAGSVFVGAWTPESVGDYASGTNHVLPTYGYTRTYSSLGLADFCKRMTVQHLTAAGLQGLGPTVTRIAQAEGLDAHKRAVTIRLEALERQA